MQIRPPQPAEFEAARALLAAHGWAHRVADAAWFARLLENSRAMVALSDGEVVGFARGVTDGLSNGYLSMVVVAPSHRRQGVGARLVRAVMGAGPGVAWVLRAERPGAREFFERLGFAASTSAMERKRAP